MFFLKKAQLDQALVRQGVGGTKVSLSNLPVYPILHQVQVIDLSLKTLTLSLREVNAVLCKDYIKADFKVTVFLKVNPNEQDIATVAQVFDIHQLNDKEYLGHYFLPQVESAIRTVTSAFEYIQLYEEREKFVNHVLEVIGRDLSGFKLDDIAIDYLEQTSQDFYNEGDFLEQMGKGKVDKLTLENRLMTTKLKAAEVEEVTKIEQEANRVRHQLELATKKTELEHRLEIARLTAEQEIIQDLASGKSPASDIDQKIEAIRARAQQERERLEQLLKQKETQDKKSNDN